MTRFFSYNGYMPYIFVSYAHKDGDSVYPIIERMQIDGYRVWFDEGIDPGTEWDDTIAENIDNCGYLIAFVSKNYLASENCKDELKYARDLSKKIVLVYLEDVQLTSGMAMRMNRLQSIFKYKYIDENEFYNKLYSSDEIGTFTSRSCRTANFKRTKKVTLNHTPRKTGHTCSASEQTVNYNDGSTYTGEFNAAGEKHGQGKMHWANGVTYEGNFKNGSMHGLGKITYANGTVYEGGFDKDKRDGLGKITLADGSIANEGKFKNDKFVGYI
jgi:hypothetical protein